jgi:hypothetical protein
MSWRDQDQWRAGPSAAPTPRQQSTLEEEGARDLPLSARLNGASGLADGLLPRESGDEMEPRSTWEGLQQDDPELAVGTSFAHRRVTLILLGANVLSVFIFMAEMDPNDAETDHLAGVFLVVLLITALSLVQSLGIRHGRQLLSMCRTRAGICGRLLARPLVAIALVIVPVGAFCNSYLATHCALKGCQNLDLYKGRTTDPDIWSDLKEVTCAAQNLLTLVGMVEVILLLCSAGGEPEPQDGSWSAQDWWQWGDRRRAQRSHKFVMFFLGLMQPVGVVLSSLDANFLTGLPIPNTRGGRGEQRATLAAYALNLPEEANENGLFVGQEYVADYAGSSGGAVSGGGSTKTGELLIRMIGQPMMVLTVLHWVCLPSILGWCGCCCNSGSGRGLSFESQRCWSFSGLTCALFFNLACWFAYMLVPADDAVGGPGGSPSHKGSCFWALPGAVVHICIFCAVALSVLFGPIVRNSRSVYVFGCLTLVGCCLYGVFGVLQFVHLQNALRSGASVSAAWGQDCDKLLYASPLPMWGLYLRSGQAMLPLAEAVYFCVLLSKRTEVRIGSHRSRVAQRSAAACACLGCLSFIVVL